MPTEKLKKFLDENGVRYLTLTHSPAYTAQEIAEASHISGRRLAKTVMVKVDGKMAMAVLPAHRHVDTAKLAAAAGADTVEIAAEAEFSAMFPDCDVGAMPPFGNLWDMQVFEDAGLRNDELIVFNAGSHTELVQLSVADFERLSGAVPVDLH